jgi:hypothetical protein
VLEVKFSTILGTNWNGPESGTLGAGRVLFVYLAADPMFPNLLGHIFIICAFFCMYFYVNKHKDKISAGRGTPRPAPDFAADRTGVQPAAAALGWVVADWVSGFPLKCSFY